MSKYIKQDDVFELVRTGVLISNGNFESVCKHIGSLPTIEVSEDCISRADLIESFLADSECKREEAKACMCSLDLMLELIEDAPSVVPKARPIEMHLDVTDDVVDRAVEQIRAEGEWELASDDDGEYGICSICGNDTDFTHYGKPYHYCPSCGAKMKKQFASKLADELNASVTQDSAKEQDEKSK